MPDYDPASIRRSFLKATGALGATALLPTASATASGDGDDEDEDEGGITTTGDPDPDSCNDCKQTCPLDNELKISGVPGTEGTIEYRIEVDHTEGGVIEYARSGERFHSCKGEVSVDYARRSGVVFRYAGELTCVSLSGPGRIQINQPAPCEGDKH